MAKTRLTPALKLRYDLFVREYIKTENGAEAYARVMPNNKREHVKVSAHRILRYPYVQKKLEAVKMALIKKADITIEKILADYQRAMDMADQLEKPEAIVNAATAQAKLVGHLRDRVETGMVGDFDGMEEISDVIAAIAEQEGPEAAAALLDYANKRQASQRPVLGQDEASGDEAALSIAKPASDAVN